MRTVAATLLALTLSPGGSLAQLLDAGAQGGKAIAQPGTPVERQQLEPDTTQPEADKAKPEADTTTDSTIRQRLGLRGSVRSGFWSSSRSLDDRGPLFGTALWTQVAPRLGSHGRLFFDGWVGAADFSRPDDVDGQVRELYLDVRLGHVDVRAGKQIIAWGRADGLNPTDNLTPRDFTLLVPDEDDQRTGVPGVRASAHRGSFSLTGIWLARFEGHTMPLNAPPGLTFRKDKPAGDARQFAIKLERVGGSLDGSISYFSGFDQLHDLSFEATADGTDVPRLKPHRIHVVGGDLAAVVGRVGVRAEAAYTRTEDRPGDNPEIKNPTFFAVAGADRTFHEYLYVNLQYLFRVVEGFTPPDGALDDAQRSTAVLLAAVSQQGRARQHGATFKVSNKWRNETLEAEASGIFFARPNQGVLRSKITYAVTDHWRVIVGGEWLRGESSTLYHLLRSNSSFFAEVRLGY